MPQQSSNVVEFDDDSAPDGRAAVQAEVDQARARFVSTKATYDSVNRQAAQMRRAPSRVVEFDDSAAPKQSWVAPRSTESKSWPTSRKDSLSPAYHSAQPAVQAETPGGQPGERAFKFEPGAGPSTNQPGIVAQTPRYQFGQSPERRLADAQAMFPPEQATPPAPLFRPRLHTAIQPPKQMDDAPRSVTVGRQSSGFHRTSPNTVSGTIQSVPDVPTSRLVTPEEARRQQGRQMAREELKQANTNGIVSGQHANIITALAKVGANAIGAAGRMVDSETLTDAAEDVRQKAEDYRALHGDESFIGNVVHGGAQMAPALLIPGGPLAFGAYEAGQAYGEGRHPAQAIGQGVTAAATAKLGGELASRFQRPLAKAPEAYLERAAGNIAAPVIVNAATGQGVHLTPEDVAFGATFGLHGGQEQAARRQSEIQRRADVRATVAPPQRLALNAAPPEALTRTPRGPFDVGPTGEAIMAQRTAPPRVLEPIPTQSVPLNRYQRRAQDARNIQQEGGSGSNRVEQQASTLYGGDRAGVESLSPQPQGQPPAEVAQRPESVVQASRVSVPQPDVYEAGRGASDRVLAPPAKGLIRNFRAGTNDASMTFADETQRDLYDLGAKMRYQPSGKVNQRAVGDIVGLRKSLSERLGIPETEVSKRALDVHTDVKAQMKGVKHLEDRRLVDNTVVAKNPTITTIKPVMPTDRSVKPESDTLLSAIQKLGFDSSTPEGAELARYLSVKEGGRPGMVNKQRMEGGQRRGVDQLITALRENGFDVVDANDLLDRVRQEQGGKPVRSNAYDHAAEAERQIRERTDVEPAEQSRTITFIDGVKNHSEFADLADRIAHGEASDEQTKRFAEIGRYELNIEPETIQSFLEESANPETHSRIDAELGVKAGEQSVVGQERQAGQREGDVDAQDKSRDVRKVENATSPIRNIPAEAQSGRLPDVGDGSSDQFSRLGTTHDGGKLPQEVSPTADQLSRVARILDDLKSQSKETGQSLISLVEDRINQQALPGMEQASLTAGDAAMLRDLAKPAARRGPSGAQQSALLETGPTVESKAAEAKQAEVSQAEAAANAPLFEGKRKQPHEMTRAEFLGDARIYKPLPTQMKEGPKKVWISTEAVQKEPFAGNLQIKRGPSQFAVYDGEKVVATYSAGDNLVVDSAYRNKGIAKQLVYEYKTMRDAEPKAASRTPAAQKINESVHRRIVEEALKRGDTVPPEVLRDYPDLIEHHSQLQNRDDAGKFILEPPKIEPVKGEHGQFINALFKSPDIDRGIPAFWANPEVRAKLGLPRLGPMAATKDALAKAIGKPRSSHLSPDDVRQWAAENGLSQDALTALDAGEAQYKAYQKRIVERKKTEGGFVRLGGAGTSKQRDIGDLFKTKERVPVEAAHQTMHDAWDEFVSATESPEGPTKEDLPSDGEAYYEKPAKEKDKVFSLRTLDSWMKANMLMGASPYSHKVGSLASNAVAEAAATPSAAAADWIISKAKGDRRSVVVDPRGMARAAGIAATDGVKEAWQIMRQGATKEQIEQYGMPNQLNTRNPVVNALVNYTFRSYKAGAHIFGTMAYQKALSNQAKAWALNEVTAGKIKGNEVSKRTQEIINGKDVPEGVTATMEGNATLAYADAVFQSENKLNDIRKKIVGDGNGAWAFGVNRVVPFMKSASNAYLKMLDYTGVGPKGAVMETARAVGRKMKTGQAFKTIEDQRAAATAWGKLPVGLALFAAGVALHRNQLMTSLVYQHDDNPQPGSVRAFGKLIDVARYSPIGLIMAAGATYDELTHDKGQDPVTAGVVTAGEGLTNLPMFQQTTDLIKTAKAMVEGKTSVPGIIGAIGKSALTRTAPTMIPGYATGRDLYKGIRESDKYTAGPIGKVLHVQNEVKAPRSLGEVKAHQAATKTFTPDLSKPFTAEDKARKTAKQEIVDLVRGGKVKEAEAKAKQLLDAGQVSKRELAMVGKRATMKNDLQYDLSRASLEDALDIVNQKDLLTNEEKQTVRKTILERINKFDADNYRGLDLPRVKQKALQFALDNLDMFSAKQQAAIRQMAAR